MLRFLHFKIDSEIFTGNHSAMKTMVDKRRVRLLRKGEQGEGPVIYWMSRDQRADDNWALLFAQELALKYKQPLAVCFCLTPDYLGATIRHYGFMLRGLAVVERALLKRAIPLFVIFGQPEDRLPQFLNEMKIGALVTDFSPLKLNRRWKKRVAERIRLPFYEVDAHNIVPVWIASKKQEYAAYTLRPKINKLLPEFLTEFRKLHKHSFKWTGDWPKNDWESLRKKLQVERSVGEISWLLPTEKAALKILQKFIENRLEDYPEKRNDPNLDFQSNLSPYLHFGQISAQRVAWEIRRAGNDSRGQEVFLEELIVRRELAENFCFYNDRYDSMQGFPAWAQKTLNDHRGDPRQYLYSLEELEAGRTHDELWNAAQHEMVARGKMHGYLRMYWAKKILEWTVAPEQALEYAIYLNDRYELDGRDPNGYAGIAWSIGGVHDRPWFEREIFGKIRYMSYEGCKRKFDVQEYIRKAKKGRE